jgi:pyruvate dehydrogenase E2 component (dihydrolipoamide acetyltransferase)
LSEKIFELPDVGEGLVEAEIVTWKVKVGDVVTLNQPLVDIETAKATVELPSPYAGRIVALHGNVGDVMEVHKPLITFDVGGDADASVAVESEEPVVEVKPAATGEGREAVLVGYGVANEDGVTTRTRRRQGSAPAPAPAPALAPAPAPALAPTPAPVATTATPGLAPRSTPPVRLYAKQNGVDLATLSGTGREGLITRDDVARALSGSPVTAPAPLRSTPITGPTSTSRFVGRELASWASGPKEERIPVKGVLRSMSDAMVQSAFSAPHAAVWVRFDVTKTMELLASLKGRRNLQDIRR